MSDLEAYINEKTKMSFQILTDKTFVRSRTYTPFHGHRCRPDLERQVWTAGVDKDEDMVVTMQARLSGVFWTPGAFV